MQTLTAQGQGREGGALVPGEPRGREPHLPGVPWDAGIMMGCMTCP